MADPALTAAENGAISNAGDRETLVAGLRDVGSPLAKRIDGISASEARTLWLVPAVGIVGACLGWGVHHGLPAVDSDTRADLVIAVSSALPTAAAVVMRFFTSSKITRLLRRRDPAPANPGKSS